MMVSSHLILCRPLLLLPPIPPIIRVFSSESALPIRWPKFWNFSFTISPSNEYSGLISFRMDWLDLLAFQGTLRSLLQTTAQKHQFFSTQLSVLCVCVCCVLSRVRLWDPVGCSPPGPSVRGILQARTLAGCHSPPGLYMHSEQ